MEKILETTHGRFWLRPYRDEDEEQVVALWEAAFGKKMDRRIWRWKFHDNPFGRQIMLCLTEDGKPVAMYAGIPYRANWNGREVSFTQLIDSMSHPGFRYATHGRKGLFIQMAEYFFECYGGSQAPVFHYGFPGKRHFKLGQRFLRYHLIKEEACYLEAAPSEIKMKHLFSFDKPERSDRFDDRYDKLFMECKNHYPCTVCRDQRFLHWRFSSHPINKYETTVLRGSRRRIKAYLVVLLQENTAGIVDLFGMNNPAVINKLVYQAANKLKKRGVEKIRVWLPKNHFIATSLIRSGFKETQEPLGIIPAGRSDHEQMDIQYAREKLFYTMADGDLF